MKLFKNIWFIITITLLCVLNIISTVFLTISISTNLSNNKIKVARIIIKILETGTNVPIENATICIIENVSYFQTNKYGNSPTIEIPVYELTNSGTLEKNWEEVTVLVYKNGYHDNILFNVKIKESQTKTGTIIHLTPIINSKNTPNIDTEKPDEKWVEKIIQKYKQ